MTQRDAVVERLAQEIAYNDDGSNEHYLGLAKAALNALHPGDDLGNGLWAAPEKPLMGMWEAFITGAEFPVDGVEMSERIKLLLLERLNNGFKAMRRAAGG